jgi:hypothetical protein
MEVATWLCPPLLVGLWSTLGLVTNYVVLVLGNKNGVLHCMQDCHKMSTCNRFTLERHARFQPNMGYIWPISSQVFIKSFKTKYIDVAFKPDPCHSRASYQSTTLALEPSTLGFEYGRPSTKWWRLSTTSGCGCLSDLMSIFNHVGGAIHNENKNRKWTVQG